MSATTAPAPAPAPAPSTVRDPRVDRLTWGLAVANLVAQVLIIATGGAVRLTGSGLGCSQWPMCEPGSFTPQFHAEATYRSAIEFGNRTVTGLLLVIAVALVWAVYRREPSASRPAALRRLAWLPLALVLVQAGLGGITVLIELHPAIVGSHMLLSLGLVAVSTYLLVRLAAGDGPPRAVVPPGVRWLAAAATLDGVVVLVLGVVATGAGPHSGDATKPYRWALDPAHISRLHAVSVWLFLALLLGMLLALRRLGAADGAPDAARGRPDGAWQAWSLLLLVTLLQGAIGYVQYFTGLPALLVGVHMVGSAALVIALGHAMSALYERAPLPREAADR